MARRHALGGFLPERRVHAVKLDLPKDDLYEEFKSGSKQDVATTMAFVRLLRKLLRDQSVGKRVVPIIPDEARTFGMESLFPDFKIYSALGQLYEPVDADLLLFESTKTEPGKYTTLAKYVESMPADQTLSTISAEVTSDAPLALPTIHDRASIGGRSGDQSELAGERLQQGLENHAGLTANE